MTLPDLKVGDTGHAELHAEIRMRLINVREFNSIQDAIDSSLPNSIVHIPAGAYVENIRVNKSLRLIGDGMGRAIVNGSVTIETDTYGVPLADIEVCGLTINGKEAPNKPLYIGAVQNCTIQRVRVNGSPMEAIYHEDVQGKVSRDIRIQDCEVFNPGLSAIDSNDTETQGFIVRGNLCRGGGAGVHFVGKGATITDNQFYDQSGFGVILTDERFTATYAQDVIISNNVFHGIGLGNTTSPRFAIRSTLSTSQEDGGILVSNNIVSDMYEVKGQPCYAIYVTGRARIRNNILRGVIGQAGEGAGIVLAGDKNGTTFGIVDGNTLEAVPLAKRFTYGILAAQTAEGLITNNVIMDGSVTTPGGALVTYTPNAVSAGNYYGKVLI